MSTQCLSPSGHVDVEHCSLPSKNVLDERCHSRCSNVQGIGISLFGARDECDFVQIKQYYVPLSFASAVVSSARARIVRKSIQYLSGEAVFCG